MPQFVLHNADAFQRQLHLGSKSVELKAQKVLPLLDITSESLRSESQYLLCKTKSLIIQAFPLLCKAGLECDYFYNQRHCHIPNLGRLSLRSIIADRSNFGPENDGIAVKRCSSLAGCLMASAGITCPACSCCVRLSGWHGRERERERESERAFGSPQAVCVCVSIVSVHAEVEARPSIRRKSHTVAVPDIFMDWVCVCEFLRGTSFAAPAF